MNKTVVEKQSADLSALLQQGQQLLEQQQFSRALTLLQPLLAEHPRHQQLHYMVAVSYRYLQRYDDALAALATLQEVAPDYGRAYQEQGHVYRALNQPESALQMYQQALALNPGLSASWRALAELHQARGERAAAANATAQFQRLQQLPRELQSVTSMLYEGKLYKAERLCRHYLQQHPHHIEGMRLLAQIGARLYILDDAEFLLESCLEFDPHNQLARFDYVNVLHKRQKFAKALEQAKVLREAQPGNPSFETAYANECVATGDYDTALQIYDQVLKQFPENSQVHLVRGHALKTVGRQPDAVAAYRRAYQTKPNFGDAFWSLANLKTYRFDDAEVAQMERELNESHTGLVDQYHLCFALGKAYEDRDDYRRSFEFYQRGNRLKQSELRYSADQTEADFERQKTVCTRDFFAERDGYGHDAPDPIFVVGLPRAGSTLIEQILASHSQIDGTLELPNILALAHRLNGRRRVGDDPRYPGILNDLNAEKFAEFGRAYIEDTRIHRQGAPYFVDKMPNNFRHIGLIHLILPNAKIIDARRHPMACCFSGFKQLFAEGQEFTYGMEQVGRYYKDYCQLMDHWDTVLPGKVLRVRYEDVVEDLETQVRRILDYLGLPFEEACLNFHQTKRSVRTASSEQVRQPLYRSGVDQWRHYESYLQPLKEALGDNLQTWERREYDTR